MDDSLLRRKDVWSLLNYLDKTQTEMLDPVLERGIYRYPVVEEFVKDDVDSVLEGLADLGFLQRQLLDSVMSCPACQGFSHLLKPVCPTCSSGRLMKGNVIEHLLCGYVDFEHEFLSHGFKCIKCGKELKTLGVDYRKTGVFFKCISCGRITAVPIRRYICTNCGRANMEEELNLKPVYRYIVVKEKFPLLKGIFYDLSPLTDYIAAKGYMVQSPAKIVGTSGVTHEFTLYINVWGQVISSGLVVDIVSEVSEEKIYEFFTKCLDVKAGASLLLVVGQASEKARKLASTFNIRLAEFVTVDELIEKSKTIIEELLERLREKELMSEAAFLEDLLRELEKK
ncbi:MAG: hypothetical protein QW463_00945 [Candidatus Caldarchaeum sp.]